MVSLTPWAEAHAAAVNLALHPAACGLCLLAVCADKATCPGSPAAAQPLVVVDDCGSCAADQILVAPAAFKNPTGYGQGGRPLPPSGWAAVAFRWVPCAPFFAASTTISMRVLPGANAYYRQITFSNAGELISAASINGQPLHRSASQLRWEWDGRGRPLNTTAPLAVQLTAASGATLVAQLPVFKEGDQQLGVQFV
ncbi:hypothetical protein COHA_010262 [Chlorella ohadii]|uniref:Expansin-like EG45 domain-containing protein n=1 Tax=Chlorella ohadii TaxID=2649997 RepID=A0AAD5H0R8_9CHLO|nr:hypothetical protein COHA_010262 [Chlorella ohadii]